MRITFLLTWADEMGGTELATFTLAANLADHHDVEILSVFKTRDEPFFPVDERIAVRYLVDRTTTPHRLVDDPDGLSPEDATALASMPSDVIDPAWEKTFDRLSDIAMVDALNGLDANVVVTTSPALMAAVVTYAPPSVRTVHAEHRTSELRGPTGEPLLIFAPRLDALVTLTERTRVWFSESLKAAAPTLAAIPNAAPARHVPKSSRRGRTITMAVRLTPDKQTDHAIRAFSKVKDRFPEWRLRIFGDGGQLRRLRRLTEDLGAADQVEFLGRTPHMADEWAKASICLLPSRAEAFPLVLLEAFAAGVPSVAYDVSTGPAEIIRHGVDGLLVAAGHVEGLAEAMADLMADPVKLDAMGEEALVGVDRFSAKRVTRLWLDLFEGLTTGDDRARRTARRRRMAAQAATSGRRFATAVPGERLTPTDDRHRDREDAILATTPGLATAGGRLAEVRDDLLAGDAALANLELVADALEAAGIVHCLLRDGRTQHRIAVDEADRDAVCAALARRFAGRPVYAELVGPRGDKPGAVPAESLTSVRSVAALRIFRPVVSSSRTLRYGPAYGCDVEFWSRDDDGQFSGPVRPTALGGSLPTIVPNASYRQGNRDYPTLREFADDLLTDVTFPIDVVYTWVDDSDPEWIRARTAHEENASGDRTAARFRNRDELRYSLRSLAMFAPWVRDVHIVTAGQTPSWLDTEHPRITVVDHRDVFADPTVLPTFNSHAIETQLHNVSGLSNHFLYLNDDVFLAQPMLPSKFFQGNGTTRFFHTPTQVPIGPLTDEDDGYFAAAKNNRELLRGKFGRVVTNGFAHAPHPLRKDVLRDIAQTFASDVERTAASRFRHRTDISMAASLHHHYGFMSGTAVPGSIRCQYIDLGNYDHHPLLTRLLTVRGADVFCLADSNSEQVGAEEQALVARTFLRAYFPVPAPWEKDGAA